MCLDVSVKLIDLTHSSIYLPQKKTHPCSIHIIQQYMISSTITKSKPVNIHNYLYFRPTLSRVYKTANIA